MKETFNFAFGMVATGCGATAIMMLTEGLFKEASACLVITTVLMTALTFINALAKEQR